MQTGAVVSPCVRTRFFNTHLCNHVILLQSGGGTEGTVLYTVRGVRGLGIRMLKLVTKTIKEIKRRLIYEYRYDERLKTKNEESTRFTDTGLVVELEHLKRNTRLKDEMFVSVKGECDIQT
jgi:hypothetical protein